jgi:hypothetical protein
MSAFERRAVSDQFCLAFPELSGTPCGQSKCALPASLLITPFNAHPTITIAKYLCPDNQWGYLQLHGTAAEVEKQETKTAGSRHDALGQGAAGCSRGKSCASCKQ